jgi:hypothetical protein
VLVDVVVSSLADRDSPIRPGRFIKMGLHLYVNLKFNRLNTLFLSWGDRAVARYGPQDGPPVGQLPCDSDQHGCVLKGRRRTRRINSCGNRIVASHSGRRNGLFADRTDPSRPNLADPTHQESKTHTPNPNPLSLVSKITGLIPARSDPDPHSAAAHTPAEHPRLHAPAASASLLARRIKRGSGRPQRQDLAVHADDDHGEEGDDLARRRQG